MTEPTSSSSSRPDRGRSTSAGRLGEAQDGRLSSTSSSPSGFTAFKDKFSRALSPNRELHRESMDRRSSFGKTMSQAESERGRQPIVSTGRGGAGNLVRSPSRGVDPDVRGGDERGREIGQRDASGDRVMHSGRGGAGNIRSPSREPRDRAVEAKEDALQARLIAEERGRPPQGGISTGRGGAGNISGGPDSRSKSRSRSAVRGAEGRSPAHTPNVNGHHGHDYLASGRGGYGNINEEHERDSVEEQKLEAQEKQDAQVRAGHDAKEHGKPHMSGRGGEGNYTKAANGQVDMGQLSLEEKEAYAKIHAHDRGRGVNTGRGGAGNIRSENSGSRERGRDGKSQGVFGSVLRNLSRAAHKDKSTERAKD